MKNNFVLPDIFLDMWKVDDEVFIKNLISNQKVEEDVISSSHILIRMFSNHNAFDAKKLFNQFLHISVVAKRIIDKEVKFKDKIALSGQEVLFLKYFYFVIALINNTYHFQVNGEIYDIKDIEYMSNSSKEKLYILLVINHVLYDMFDVLFTERIFNGLDVYAKQNSDFLGKNQFSDVITIPDKLEINQDFRFVDFHFHNIVNNTFIKFLVINPADTPKSSFDQTTISTSRLLDKRFNINVVNFFIVFPEICIGLIHLGPGRGEVRPIFDLIKDNKINKYILKNVMEADHKIFANDIYLSDDQEIIFKPYKLDKKQIDFINDTLKQL